MSGQPEWWTPGMPDPQKRQREAARRTASTGDRDAFPSLRPLMEQVTRSTPEERGTA